MKLPYPSIYTSPYGEFVIPKEFEAIRWTFGGKPDRRVKQAELLEKFNQWLHAQEVAAGKVVTE